MTTGSQTSSPLQEPKRAESQHLCLMLALLSLLLIHPLFPDGPGGRALLLILNSATLVAGIYAVSDDRKQTVIGFGLGILWFGLAWGDYVLDSQTARVPTLVVAVAFYLYAIVRVLRFVLGPAEVTKAKIYGAVSVYLLMGVAWASCYSLIDLVQPDSFHFSELYGSGFVPSFGDFLYFSFVTLTTLGYGDISPTSPPARSFAMMEAVSGVLYLAVLVGRLVSLYRPRGDV